MTEPLIEALRADIARTQASDIRKLRSDVNHLVQPLIGTLRMAERDGPDSDWTRDFVTSPASMAHAIDRLRLVLALMDEAVTGEHADEAHRGRHGVGLNHYPTLADPDDALR